MIIRQFTLRNSNYVIKLSEPIEIDDYTAEAVMDDAGRSDIAIYCLGKEIEKLTKQVAELKASLASNNTV